MTKITVNNTHRFNSFTRISVMVITFPLLCVRFIFQRNSYCYSSAFQVMATNRKAILFTIKQFDALIDILKSKSAFLYGNFIRISINLLLDLGQFVGGKSNSIILHF